jgi:hypothetical protein
MQNDDDDNFVKIWGDIVIYMCLILTVFCVFFGRVMKTIDAARLAIVSLLNVLRLNMIQRMKMGSSILKMVDLLSKSPTM